MLTASLRPDAYYGEGANVDSVKAVIIPVGPFTFAAAIGCHQPPFGSPAEGFTAYAAPRGER
jgi:hypothetical protein